MFSFKKFFSSFYSDNDVNYTYTPLHSELSDPVKCERPKKEVHFEKRDDLKNILKIFIQEQLWKWSPMTTHQFAMGYPNLCSVWQRLSELKKLGYLSAEKQDTPYGKRYVWSYTQKGYDAIYKK